MATVIQVRRDTAANWTTVGASVTLASGEIGYETDTRNIKIGDGATVWNSLTYYQLPNLDVANATSTDLNNALYRRMGRFLLKTTSDTWTNTPASATNFTAASGNCVMIVTHHDDNPSTGTLAQFVLQQLTQITSAGAVARTWYRLYDGTNYSAWTRNVDLQTNGNFGLGTSTPQSLLHVAGGNVTISTGADVTTANQVIGQIDFRSDDASAGASGTMGSIAVRNAAGGAWGAAADADTYMTFSTAVDGTSTERMRIASDGKVGIGVTPTRNLSVKDASTGVGLQLINSATGDASTDGLVITQTSANASILNQENGTLTIGTNNTTGITMDASQNVTIAGDLTVSGGDIVGVATTNIANAATTLTLGSSTAAQTVNVSTGITASGSTKAVNIGTNSAAGSTTTVTLGSSSGTSTVAIQGNATVSGTAAITGATTTTGLVTANGGITVPSGKTLTVAGAFALTGDTIQTSEIANNAVTNAIIRQSAARSVVGNSTASTANVADITASNASDAVLRESGGAIGFGTVATAGIANNAVATAKIADDAVTADKLRDDAVTDGNRAVTTNHIRDVAITTAKIADDAVTADKLRDDASTDANRAVTTNHIRDNAVTTAKITDSNVTYAKIQNVSATDKLLGRSSAGAGVVEEINCTAAGRALLDDATAAAQRTTLGVVSLAEMSAPGTGANSIGVGSIFFARQSVSSANNQVSSGTSYTAVAVGTAAGFKVGITGGEYLYNTSAALGVTQALATGAVVKCVGGVDIATNPVTFFAMFIRTS
jgi:hypothetical protein